MIVIASWVRIHDRIEKAEMLPQADDLPHVIGSDMQRVTLPKASPFGGLITQTAMMKHTANGTTTSPVLRVLRDCAACRLPQRNAMRAPDQMPVSRSVESPNWSSSSPPHSIRLRNRLHIRRLGELR